MDAPPIVAGRTVADGGDAFHGDQLGADPVAAWDEAAAASGAAFAEPGALQRTVHLSYGDRPAEGYCAELTADLLVHSWDLARGIGADDTPDSGLVDFVYEQFAPHAQALAQSGLFAPSVEVAEDADRQTKLLALTGRQV